MAISPPSDILLDVANAADPAQVRVATARLAKLASDPTAANTDFSQALSTAVHDDKPPVPTAPVAPTVGAPPGTSQTKAKTPTEAYQKFEALLLQNFVEAMLPKDDDLYGDKESAGAYRSMMAEQFAAQLSKAGGIGIAKAIAAKHPAPTHAPVALPSVAPTNV